MTAIINPANETAIAEVEFLDADAVSEAIGRAANVLPRWQEISPNDRRRLLIEFAEKVRDNAEVLATLECQNAGHPIRSARSEALETADVIEYFAGLAERVLGHQIPVSGGVDLTIRQPLGLVAVIVPWNFPMLIASWGFAPALATGNVVLLKPAEATPLTALKLEELAKEAGLPEYVFQVLPGLGEVAGRSLVADPRIGKVNFTGSTRVGKEIARRCADQLKRFTLELGGKSANLVFADADIDRAAALAPYAVFDNAGQDCCARSRLLVEAPAMDRFLERFEQAVNSIKVGDPKEESTEMGPLISKTQRERVTRYIEGEEVLFQGKAPKPPGFWFPPTVLAGRDPDSRACTEEIFGPVVSVIPFSSEDEAVALANSTVYGLSGSIWTRDVGKALRVAAKIETGNLSVNSNSSVRHHTPFGGFKQSGIGRELGPDAYEAFTEVKNIFISYE
jgi:acyl-CoA reductase-like NAD-dependent aldehyde dehydrogenase